MTDRKELQNPVSLFPLPSTVFYPGVFLSLHIFEPRYRKMVQDALESHRLIGMVLLKPEWEENYHDRPAVASVGCAGKIDTSQSLPNGKFNIVLKGLSRFRILDEIGGKPYRLAKVDFLEEINDEMTDFSTDCLAAKLLACYDQCINLLSQKHKSKKELKHCKRLSHMIDQIAFQFGFEIAEKQSFLEELDVRKRAETIIAMLELKTQIITTSKSRYDKGTDVQMN